MRMIHSAGTWPDASTRRRGEVTSALGLGGNGHACWGFADEATFHHAAVDFLLDGLRLGQRVLYVSSEQREVQRAALSPLGDIDDMLRRGELSLAHIDEIYDPGPVDTTVQLARYAAQTDQALCDGYTGLRAVANATSLVADPARHEAHDRWESVADRYMASHPLAALCGYDENAVPDELLADLQCVHPASHDGEHRLPFRLAYLGDDTLALEGEIDTFSTNDLQRILATVLTETSEPTALDLQALRFINHRALIVLNDYTSKHAIPLRSMPAIARQLGELLELSLADA
jgi:hypothetical protein